jgi:hypothetical protein
VWVTRGASVVEIDPATNRIVGRFATPYATGLAAGLGAVWVAAGRRLIRLEPGKAMVSFPLDGLPAPVLAPTVGHAAVWSIVYNGLGEVWRISTNGEAAILGGLGRYPLAVTVSDGAAWTIDTRGIVTRINAAGMRSVDRIATAPTIRSALTTTDGYLWAAIESPD